MNSAFLIRFQETPVTCADERTAKTHTHVEREKADEGRVPLAGTKTITEVQGEGGDNDPASRNYYALPR
jgi:hypothetical protein